MIHLEHEHQKSFIKWVRAAYKDLLVFAIPNGGKRHIGVAKKMKAEGQLSGVPDIMVAHDNGVYHGLFIEMKSEKGRLSDSQKSIKDKLEKEGYQVEVCYGWVEAMDCVKNYVGTK